MEERLLELIRLALQYEATDIHFHSAFNEVEIQLRVGGIMRKVKGKFNDQKLIRYLQYLSGMDIGTVSKGQTGVFEMEVNKRIISLRFSYLFSNNLINGCLRILNQTKALCVDNLSTIKTQNEYFKKIIKEDKGLILFSGPTGAGKTTTLYTLLKSIENKEIISIEDPVEIYQSSFTQININDILGVDYKEAIKQILRHDPDIIMIGEIRDTKAAQGALEAANTGHLVLATIHASSASNIILRMVGLGCKEDELYENLICLSGQRMLASESGLRKVIYEIMDKDEIAYYRKNNKHSNAFLSLEAQL